MNANKKREQSAKLYDYIVELSAVPISSHRTNCRYNDVLLTEGEK
jgi:hypothetical protein